MRSGHLVFAALAIAPAVALATPSFRDAPGAYHDAERVSYADVQRVLDAHCAGCHTGPEAAAGLHLGAWEEVVAGSRYGAAVIPFDAARSLMIGMTTRMVGGPHPAERGNDPLSDAEATLIAEWVEQGARSPSDAVPFADAERLLYVANQGAATVSVIDMETNLLIRIVDMRELGFAPDCMPHYIVVEPDGSHWYVSLIGANAVLKFTRENELVGRFDFERPGLLAIDPNGDALYVARSMMAVNPPSALGVVRRSDMSVEEVETFLPRPHALAITPDGHNVFTASLAVNQIAVLDATDETVEITNLAGDRPYTFIGFAVSPNGRWMVGSTELTAKLFVFDLDRIPDMTPIDSIEVGAAPWHPVFTLDGRFVYVGNNWDNSISVVDMTERAVVAVVRGRGIAQPHGSAVSPDGRYAYVSSRNLEMPEGHTKASHRYAPRFDLGDNATTGSVVVIDTETHEIVKIIEVPDYGAGLGTAARKP